MPILEKKKKTRKLTEVIQIGKSLVFLEKQTFIFWPENLISGVYFWNLQSDFINYSPTLLYLMKDQTWDQTGFFHLAFQYYESKFACLSMSGLIEINIEWLCSILILLASKKCRLKQSIFETAAVWRPWLQVIML